MSVNINLYANNDFHYSGYAWIQFEMFGDARSINTCDVPEMLDMLGKLRDELGEEHVLTEYIYDISKFDFFRANPCGVSMDPAFLAEHWLRRIAQSDESARPLTGKEFCGIHAEMNAERAAELDQATLDSGRTLPSPHVVFVWRDWTQTVVRDEIDRVTADLTEQMAVAEDALRDAIAAADAQVDADMVGVDWDTRKIGNWHTDDGLDVHEFVHTITVNGTRFKVREGDLFDAGPYIRFEDGVQRHDSPETERVYALVEKYGERARGSLGMRTM